MKIEELEISRFAKEGALKALEDVTLVVNEEVAVENYLAGRDPNYTSNTPGKYILTKEAEMLLIHCTIGFDYTPYIRNMLSGFHPITGNKFIHTIYDASKTLDITINNERMSEHEVHKLLDYMTNGGDNSICTNIYYNMRNPFDLKSISESSISSYDTNMHSDEMILGFLGIILMEE